MSPSSKEIASLSDLFLHGLQDIYYAEKRIVQALPKLIDAATDSDLKSGLQEHLEETEQQVERLEDVFEKLDQDAKGEKCPAIDGIIQEGEDTLDEIVDESVKNAAIVAAAQAVEHYEITRYGTLIAWAAELGRDDLIATLQDTLDEEEAADEKLTQMAERRVNPGAPGANARRKRKSGSSSRRSAKVKRSGVAKQSASRGRKSASGSRKTAASSRSAPTRRKKPAKSAKKVKKSTSRR